MDTAFDAISTPGINPPAAFDRLRAGLHDAADPARIADSRTRDTISQLRTRAAFFRDTMELYRGLGLGHWYGELAQRHDELADEIASVATANGIIGGGA